MQYVRAFEEAIREIAPHIPPQRIPTTFGGLVDYLKPPNARSGTALAAQVLMDADAARGVPISGKNPQGAYYRRVQRYRAAEGTAPKGGQQARGAIRGQLDEAIKALRGYIKDRAVGELREKGVTMQVSGTVRFGGTRTAEYDLPAIFLPGWLLDRAWQVEGETDPATGLPEMVEHPAPLDALVVPNMEEAANGFDYYYWRVYDPDGKIPGYSYIVSVDPGGLTLELGDTTSLHYPRPRRA